MPDGIDYRGMTPEQATKIGMLGQQSRQRMSQDVMNLAAQRLSERQFTEQKRQARVQEKLKKTQLALNQMFEKKKLQLQEQRNEAYRKQVENQETLTESKINESQREQQRIEQQMAALDGLKGTEIETTMGKMNVLQYASLQQLGVPVETKDSEWKKGWTIETENGQQAVWFKPDTMETKVLDFGMKPEQKKETREKIRKGYDDVADVASENLNADSFYGLQEGDQQVMNEIKTLGNEMLVSDEYEWQDARRAGEKAYREVKQYRSQIDRLVGEPKEDQKAVNRMVKLALKYEGMTKDQMELFTSDWIIQRLMEQGYDEFQGAKMIQNAVEKMGG